MVVEGGVRGLWGGQHAAEQVSVLSILFGGFDPPTVLFGYPPTIPLSSVSVSSISPAGWAGNIARSASLRLSRYSSSFHARIIFVVFIKLLLSCLLWASCLFPAYTTIWL